MYMKLCGLIVNYCDVFISYMNSHYGTHSLQRIHWWSTSWMVWWWVNVQQIFFLSFFFFGWTTPFTCYIAMMENIITVWFLGYFLSSDFHFQIHLHFHYQVNYKSKVQFTPAKVVRCMRTIMPEPLDCFLFLEHICKSSISHVQQNPQNLQNTTVSVSNSPECSPHPYHKIFLSQSFCSGI